MTDRNIHTQSPESETNTSTDAILERNVEQLMTRAHEPPQMATAARARILDALRAELPGKPEPAVRRWLRSPRFAMVGLACASALALVAISQLVDDNPARTAVHDNADQPPRWVELVDGSRALLNRGAHMVELGPRHLRLSRGELLLDVTKGDGTFVVDAPNGRVVVLGTRFVVNADTDRTWAAVIRGQVRLENGFGRTTLAAGELGTLRRNQAPTRRPAPRLSHLTSWAKAAQLERTPTPKPARRGTLLARMPNWQQKQYPLPMRKLTVDVHVENQVARVAIDQTFFNEQNQQLEGVYRFPLPANASISRLAMYVAGKRMESAIVERRRAREIYEGIVYRRRDPALLEWMAGNLFKVRIFPLPARQEKRILLSYTQSVEQLYDDYRIEVPIPEVDRPVGSVTYRVRIVGCAGCQLRSPSHDVSVRSDGEDALVTFTRKNYEIGDDLLLFVRDKRKRTSVAHHRVGKHHYWMVRSQPDFAKASVKRTAKPRRWVIVNDTSASRGPLERKAQGYIVQRLLRELDERDQINVVAFDTTARTMSKSFVSVGRADRIAVSRFITEQSRDGVGATDLELALNTAVSLLGGAGAADYEPHILYLGDGIVTGGERTLAKLRGVVRGKATVVAIAVGDRMDSVVLRGLAAATGGMFTTMNPGDDLAWRTFDTIAALNTPRLIDVEAELVDAKGNVLHGGATYASARQLADGEELSVVARLDSDIRPDALVLRATLDGKPWTRRVPLNTATRQPGAYLPRLWAQRRVTALIADGAKNHKSELVSLGEKHFLMTPYTSLLVLENDKMYAQYKVKRDRKLGWAAYRVPDTIKVVREAQSGFSPADPNVSLDAIMLRRPLQLVRSYYQNVAGNIDGFRLRLRGWGDVVTTGAGAAPIGGTTSTLLTLSSREVTERIADETGANANRWRRIDVVAAAGKSGARARDWTVLDNRRRRAAFDGDDKSVRQPLARPTSSTAPRPDTEKAKSNVGVKGESVFARVLNEEGGLRQQRLTRGLVGRLGRFHGRGGGGYYRYTNAPYPVAYTSPRDPRLDDLTEFVPAMFVNQLDADLYELLRSVRAHRRGSITSDARALVERARAAIAARSYKNKHGSVLSVKADGTFTIAATTESKLREQTRFDGTKLVHSYPQLGLAVERDVSDGVALVLSHIAPFVVPDAASLARWYDVSLAGPATLRLRWSKKADAPAIEIALDDSLRVTEMRIVRKGNKTVDVAVRYSATGLVVERDGERLAWDYSAAPAAAQAAPATRVQMPLRRPAYWQAKSRKTTVGSMEWRHIQRQLLASYVAQHQLHNVQRTVAALITAGAKLTRGEVVLASPSVSRMPRLEMLTSNLGAWAKGDAIADYLTTSWRFYRKLERDVFAGLAKRARGSLVGMLSSFRDALDRAVYTQDHDAAKKRIEAFAAAYDVPALRYILAHRFGTRWRYKAPLQAFAVWKLVGSDIDSDDPFVSIAALEAGRALYYGRKYAEAADYYSTLLKTAKRMPRIDYTIINAFRSSGRGMAGWRMFWSRWRNKVLKSDDAYQLIELLNTARIAGESSDYDRIIGRLTSVELDNATTVAAVASTLRAFNRNHQALAVLEPWLATKGKKQPVAALVELASWITESQGRPAEAAKYLELAMDAYYKKPVALSVMRRDYARLVRLYTRLAQSARKAERERYIDKALRAAADWRRSDPDNVQIDRSAATLLFSVQRGEQAWRYLSSRIERHPMEGNAYKDVAEALEKEGHMRLAEPLWRRAVEVDPTNPTWLLRHAQALYSLDREDEARAQVQKILDQTWHNRWFRVKAQAKNLKRLYAK